MTELREQGMPTLLVCSLSDEESALAARADVLVHGPTGVLDLLRDLTRLADGWVTGFRCAATR